MIDPGRIRLAAPADGAALAEIYRPAVTDSSISFELEPPDAAEMSRRVAHVLETTPWLVHESGGSVLGYAYAAPFRERPAYRWSVECSAYVHTSAHRRGIARALYSSLFAALVVQGFRTCFAGITLPNPGSVGLHASFGFTPVGVYHGAGYKRGEWHDVGWFERLLAPHIVDPPPPRMLPRCRDDAAFRAALDAGAAPSPAQRPR